MKWLKANFDKIIFIIYIAVYLIAATTIALNQPMGLDNYAMANPPDEPARFLIPWYIYNTGHLPTGLEAETRAAGYGISYGVYPILPYIIQGFILKLVGIFTSSLKILIYAARFVNVCFGLLTAIFVYKISKRIFTDPRFRWLFSFITMFIPQHIFLHTYVNTDSMCMLSTAIIIYSLISIYQDNINLKNSILLSVGLIFCIMSYYNAYGYVLISIILVIGSFVKHNGTNYKSMLKWCSFIAVLVFIGAGWHFIRNGIILSGDFLGMRTMNELKQTYADPSVLNMSTYYKKGYGIIQMMKEMDFFGGAFLSMIACYGSLNIMGSIWIYRFYKVLFAGMLIWPIMRIISFKCGEKIDKRKLFFDICMVITVLIPIVLLIYYAYKIDGQNQGRYIMPILIPVVWCITRGYERLFSIKKFPVIIKSIFCYACMITTVILLFSFIYEKAMPMYRLAGFVLPKLPNFL